MPLALRASFQQIREHALAVLSEVPAPKAPFHRSAYYGLLVGLFGVFGLYCAGLIVNAETSSVLAIPSPQVVSISSPLKQNAVDMEVELVSIPDDNGNPFEAYKRPFLGTDKPVIGLALTGYGISEDLSKEALAELPENITFLLSPYSSDIKSLAQKTFSKQQEFWLSIPIQNNDYPYDDTGPYTVLTQANSYNNIKKLNGSLNSTTGYAGVTFSNVGAFDANPSMFRAVMDDLFGRNLGFLELNPNAPRTAMNFAMINGAPTLQADFDLNNSSFKDIERLAMERGHAIATIALTPRAIPTIKRWAATLEAKNITLAPLSAVYEIKRNRGNDE